MDTSITFDMAFRALKNMTLTKQETKLLQVFCKDAITSKKWKEMDEFINQALDDDDTITPNIRKFFEKLKCKEFWDYANRDSKVGIKNYEMKISFESKEYKNIDFRYISSTKSTYQLISIGDKTFKFHKDYEMLKEKFKWSDEDIQSLIDVLDGISYHFQVENDVDIDWSVYEDEDN